MVLVLMVIRLAILVRANCRHSISDISWFQIDGRFKPLTRQLIERSSLYPKTSKQSTSWSLKGLRTLGWRV